MLEQSFYLYSIKNPEHNPENPDSCSTYVITERISFVKGHRPEKLDIPGWKGWVDELVMQGKHTF